MVRFWEVSYSNFGTYEIRYINAVSNYINTFSIKKSGLHFNLASNFLM